MPDITVENLGKVFMIILKKIAAAVILITLTQGCNDEITQGELPPAAFSDIVINLDLPQYQDLTFDNGHITLSEGVRGIILFRVNASKYNAFEINCTYQPFDACSSVRVDQSNLFLRDDCCGSIFDTDDGFPTSGPATIPLRRYSVSLQGRILTITDDILL